MTLDMSNTDKLADFRADALRLGIDVVAPSVMTSYRDFEVGENRIFYSLAAIKGVGDAAVEHIVEKRADGPFQSLEDFAQRIDPMMVGVETIMAAAAFAHASATSDQIDIFGAGTAARRPEAIRLPAAEPWLPAERLHREFQAVGFYLSAHPLD